MKEILEFPALAANEHRILILLEFLLFLAALPASSGCRIKHTVKITVPAKILQAKTASFDQLLGIVSNYDKINDLSSSSLRLTLTSGKWESGELEKYVRAPGYILLRRPDSMHLAFQYPITKMMALDFLSIDDEFRAWIPSKDRLYIGNNSATELVAEDLPNSPVIPIRGTHIFEAILPQSIRMDSPEILVSMFEESDASAKYYVLLVSFSKESNAHRVFPARRIWIERSELKIARQQYFLDDGQIVSDIVYSNMTLVNGFFLPLRIQMNRPLDGYALDIEFKGWRANSGLPDTAFVLKTPEEAQTIHLKEKTRSSAF